ncbi:MAG: MCE family protein [Candidatus Omnitrophica bacterium]|nr:MCE family protein [Candidatus Omnitrophota bacterium]
MSDKQDQARYLAAGLFFVTAIVGLIFVIFTIGKNQGFHQKKFTVTVLFRNIGGLNEGAPTRLAGVNVGNVETIDFLPQPREGRRVKVVLGIAEKYRGQLAGSVRFMIRTEGLLGEKLIEIAPLDDGKPMDLARPIIGEDPLDVQDLATVFAGAAESFTKTSENLQHIDLQGLAGMMQDSSRSLLMTSDGINDILAEFKGITRKSKRILDRLETRLIDGNLFRVF